jgi:hypothetical protein
MTLSDKVYLQLSSRSDTDNDATNRIALKCESVAMNTGKNVLAFPIPGSGFLTGESTSLALDLGMATKTISLSGIITDQIIYKQFDKDAIDEERQFAAGTYPFYASASGFVQVRMTAQEVAQLIHSYTDSSFLQQHQNLNELLILFPSFIGKDYLYHTDLGITASSAQADVDALNVEDAPLLAFNYGVRETGKDGNELDGSGTVISTSKIGSKYTGTGDAKGVKGFIRSFNSTMEGGNPFVAFTLEFEVALTGL